jgi:hypothetical protein
MVVWGRRGYYDLDAADQIVFHPDTRYETGAYKGKHFTPDIAIGLPTVGSVYDFGTEQYVPIISMDQDYAKIVPGSSKQGATNLSIRVDKNTGVYRGTDTEGDPNPGNTTAAPDFSTDPATWN